MMRFAVIGPVGQDGPHSEKYYGPLFVGWEKTPEGAYVHLNVTLRLFKRVGVSVVLRKNWFTLTIGR